MGKGQGQGQGGAIDAKVASAIAKVSRVGLYRAASSSGELSSGMRSLATHNAAYAGATRAEANAIATGKVGTKNGGSRFAPVTVVVDHGAIHLSDGRHRLEAARAAGATKIRAVVYTYHRGRKYGREVNVKI